VDLRDSETDREFRRELRRWLADTVADVGPAPRPDDWTARRAYDAGWQRTLFDAGYAGIDWPREYGGRGATPTEHLIFLEESARAHAPDVGVNFVGLLHAGPTIIVEGTDAQRAQHLPAILRGDEMWCQGFSEPDAGSDLAGLRTRAVRDGDHYIVTGQKIWTSRAATADYCELLVRTDPDAPKRKGISWLIMPMDLPGIEVRPLVTLEGSAEFAELFLDEVAVPASGLVGQENDGWRVTQVTFSFERGTSFVGEMLQAMNLAQDLAAAAHQQTRGAGSAWDDIGLRRDIGTIGAELDALWNYTKRNVTRGAHGVLSAEGGSTFKLYFSEVLHRLGQLTLRVLDRARLSLDDLPTTATGPHWVNGHLTLGALHAFGVGIGGGTTQIQRKILAEQVLALPREPR
jgi:alkylation response protein AidB-like acyl-CoA dehydrogenase